MQVPSYEHARMSEHLKASSPDSLSRSRIIPKVVKCVVLSSTLSGLLGCGVGIVSKEGSSVSLEAVTGRVHGGQAPIQGATVTLYHTDPSATTYGAPGIKVGTAATDINGNFTLAPSASSANCPAGAQVYITAAGGYQSGQPSSAANLNMLELAALGDCSGVSASTWVIVNEITTVAAAYALSSFITTGIDPQNSTLYTANIGAPIAASTLSNAVTATTPAGLVHAFMNARNLADPSTGSPLSTIAANSNGATVGGSVPYTELNSLADMMQACVDSQSSPGSLSATCNTLFTLTPSIAGVIPGNTLQAFANLARNPYPSAAAMNATSGLFSLVKSTAAFQPTLTAVPTDWSVSIVYGHGTLPAGYYFSLDQNDTAYFGLVTTSATTPALYGVSPYGVTVPRFAAQSSGSSARGIAPDSLGNIWLSNNSASIDRFSTSTGALQSTFTSTVGGLSPVAVDRANNVWIGHYVSGSGVNLEEAAYDGTGSWTLNYTASPGANTGSNGITIDADQNVWSAGYYSGGTQVVLLPNLGTDGSPAYTTSGTAITAVTATAGTKPYSVVIDGNGNAWTGITGSNTTATTGVIPMTPNAKLSATSISAGTLILGTTTGPNGNQLGTTAVQAMAIDGAGTIFIPDNQNYSVGIHMYSTQTANTLTPVNGLKSCYLATTATTVCGGTSSAAVSKPRQPAIDSTGSVWAGIDSGGVVQIIGVAAPSYPLLSVGKPSLSPGLTSVASLP